jgi:hypothetical protein
MKSACVLFAALAVASLSLLAEEKKAPAPKYNCKEIMKVGFKEGLCKKVADGKATQEEAEKLFELVTALAANEPPRGDAASWKSKTEALLAAAKGCVDGKEGAAEVLAKAMNCAACHKEHKPPQE